MNEIYLLDEHSRTLPLERLRCKDEDRELQRLLESNLDLLPGAQIDPDAPRRWLMIKREMPVTDPATGQARWSIDMFLADQYGIPTLIECKRCDDSRTRREVIAQMLEYAANGHHYWTASEMRSHAEASAGSAEVLKKNLDAIRGMDDLAVEQFFIQVEQNLREAKMRLVFFLEDSPNELRSLVDFMNRQMKDTEVILVEARQYQHQNQRIVVPWLFGFTEEARVAKRDSRAETIRGTTDKTESAFWSALDTNDLSPATKQDVHQLVDSWKSGQLSAYGYPFWGASCIYVTSVLPKRGLFSVMRNGNLEMYFGYWDETKYQDIGERQIAFRDEFIQLIENTFELSFDEKKQKGFPRIPTAIWISHAEKFQAALANLLGKYVN
jgi:hypothetical protein